MNSLPSTPFVDAADPWNKRFEGAACRFGAEPNASRREHARLWQPGQRVLCAAGAAPLTINTMSEKTLQAFAAHGSVNGAIPDDGVDAEAAQAGVDIVALVAQLQREGRNPFTKSWTDLLAVVTAKSAQWHKPVTQKEENKR